MDPNDHKDLLSSDDSYTVFCPELLKTNAATHVKRKILIFLQCQQVAEYLFNCRTSKVKSSVNPFIGEFNSLFISNMTFMPTTIKFALASVHPPNTDSFFRMVKESYSSCRQIIENGGNYDLYLLASLLNKNYCESIYHTNETGVNNLMSKFGIKHVPYHLGHYPIFDPALMSIFGPEYYNYKLYKNHYSEMNDKEKQLFMSSHKIIKGGIIDTIAEFEEGDTVLGGLLRIEAAVGPVKQLERIRKNAPLTSDQLKSITMDDPLILLRKPSTMTELKFKITHKLYTNGSKEGLKNLASSLFYGRVSASVSANCFYIPGQSKERTTYVECLRHLIEAESPIEDLDAQIKFLYPKFVDYDLFLNFESRNMSFRVRNPFEIQTVQTLVTHKIYSKLTQSTLEVLEFKWGLKNIPEDLTTRVERDFNILKFHYPLIKESLEKTLEQFSGERENQIKGVLMLILKLFSLRDRSFKAVVFGSGSGDITKTYQTLIERNMSSSITTELFDYTLPQSQLHSYEQMYCAYNHHILKQFSEGKTPIGSMWDEIDSKELDLLMTDTQINRNNKKRVFMSALASGCIKDVDEWSGKIGLILHYWFRKQKFQSGLYVGDFDIVLFMGNKKLRCEYNEKKKLYSLTKQNIEDPELLHKFISELASLLQTAIPNIIAKSGNGNYIVQDDKILQTIGDGFLIRDSKINHIDKFQKCHLKVDNQWIKLVDDVGHQLFNIEIGLLNSTYIASKKYDFEVFNMRFVQLCKMGAFDQNYTVAYKTRRELLKYLDNINVFKPDVTQSTKDRLGLPKDWGERKKEDVEEANDEYDESMDMQFYIDVDLNPEDFKDIIGKSTEEWPVTELLNFLGNTDAIFSMNVSPKIQNTFRLFNLIKYLKHDIITRMFIVNNKINKEIISSLSTFLIDSNKRPILYSLISYFDRLHQVPSLSAPSGLTLDVCEDFLQKFNVSTRAHQGSIDFD
jgi:hypothetical protein